MVSPARGPGLWVNGVRQVDGALHLSADDRGLLLADGAFETMRARGGRVFRLDEHLARLQRALDLLAIPAPAGLRDWVRRAAGDGGSEEVGVRLTVTRGAGPAGLAPPVDAHPVVIVSVRPFPVVPAAARRDGLRAHVLSGRRNARAMTAGLKTLAYTDTVAGWIEAARAGADEGLWLDTDGQCAEALASNLFIRNGGALWTPPVSCGALPGITRGIVMGLARAEGLAVAERAFDITVLFQADEAFLTSTLRGVVGLTHVADHPIGIGVPGPWTRMFSEAYAALVARELGEP